MSKIEFNKVVPRFYMMEMLNTTFVWAHLTEKGHLTMLADLTSRGHTNLRTYIYEPRDSTEEMMKKAKNLNDNA